MTVTAPPFDDFARHLAQALRVDPGPHIAEATDLFEEWMLDSLQAFEMILVVETMADVALPPPTIPEIFTVGDAYRYLVSLIEDTGDR